MRKSMSSPRVPRLPHINRRPIEAGRAPLSFFGFPVGCPRHFLRCSGRLTAPDFFSPQTTHAGGKLPFPFSPLVSPPLRTNLLLVPAPSVSLPVSGLRLFFFVWVVLPIVVFLLLSPTFFPPPTPAIGSSPIYISTGSPPVGTFPLVPTYEVGPPTVASPPPKRSLSNFWWRFLRPS